VLLIGLRKALCLARALAGPCDSRTFVGSVLTPGVSLKGCRIDPDHPDNPTSDLYLVRMGRVPLK
jgi:hypothetical protein